MKRHSPGILLVLALLTLIPSRSWARYNPEWAWKTHKSDHFTLYYPQGSEDFAQRVLALEDEVYSDVTGYLGISPPHCPIVLNPGTDLFNGFYSPFPNRISLYETPYHSLRGFGPSSDMMDAVFSHEYSHFAHITTRLGWYGKLSPLLGRDSAITNILSPGWIIEGITTNAETLFTDGGRGRCTYFRGEMMSFTEDEGLWNLSAAGTYPPYDPPSNRFYLSGYFMVDYLNRTFGDDAFARLSRYQAMHPLGLTAEALENVTGTNAQTFYRGFLDDFKEKTQDVKDQASAMIVPQGKPLLSEKREDFPDYFWTARQTILAFRTGYDKVNALVEVDPGTGRILSETPTGRVNALGRMNTMGDNRIVYAGYYPSLLGQGDLVETDITVFDMKTGKSRRLTRGEHIFSADLSHDRYQFVAVKRTGMWTGLVLMDSDGKDPRPLVSKPGYLFEAPSFSPDDSSIACVVKSGQNSDIALVNPVSGEMKTLFQSDVYEDNDPSFSPDGTWLVFSSNRSGVWNIFAWDLIQKKLYQMTSVNYGAIRPRLSPDGKTLSYLSLHRGVHHLLTVPFDPASGVKTFVKQGEDVPSPDLARLTPKKNLDPRPMGFNDIYLPFIHVPFIISDEEDTLAGIYVAGGDPVGLNTYTAFFNYGLDSNHPGYDISLTNRSFWPDITLRAYNKADELSVFNRDFWLEEQAVELSTGFNMIHRVVPDDISSRLILGGRYKWLDSLDDGLIVNEEKNQATSFFGEWTLARRPDVPQRDMLPTWGQDVMLAYEETVDDLGSEFSARNTLIGITQYLPAFIKHHSLGVKAVLQKQSGDLSFDKDYSLPRGYSDSDDEGDLNLSNNLLLSMEYHFPIVYPDKGLGLSVLHFNVLKSSLFSDWGAGWETNLSADDWVDKARLVLGASIRTEAMFFSMVPVEIGIEAGYKVDEHEQFANVIFLLGF